MEMFNSACDTSYPLKLVMQFYSGDTLSCTIWCTVLHTLHRREVSPPHSVVMMVVVLSQKFPANPQFIFRAEWSVLIG